MKLIVGLGNPGKQYANTRHNTGFMFVDALAKEYNAKFKLNVSLKCEITDILINNEKVIIIKPQTYMNLSGTSVKLVCKYFDISTEDILIIHDDLDLEVGTIRFRSHGSSGGHNGLKNIFEELNTQEIKRLKVGISKVDAKDMIDYVLGTFSKDEFNIISVFIDKVNEMIADFCTISFENLMSRYNN